MIDKKFLVPDVIDPAETVCVQLAIPNDTKHIAAFWGALEQLAKAYNWEDSYAAGSQTAYVWQDVLEGASEAVKIGENCMLDCDDVEDCLGTSTIINIIEGDIVTNETNIVNNETNITNNETNITNIVTGGNDTNVYPDLPTQSEPDELCGASYRVAVEIIELVEQTVIDVGVLLQAAWLLSWLGIGGWLGTQLSLFWDYIFANEVALTGVDFGVYEDQIAEALYCAELDVAQAIIDLDPAIPALRRDAIIAALESATDAQIALWAFVGSLDGTQDCSSVVCAACAFFDFTVSDYDFETYDAASFPGDQLWGAHVGAGWQHTNLTWGPGGGERTADGIAIRREHAGGVNNITRIEVVYDYELGLADPANAAYTMRVQLYNGGVLQLDTYPPPHPPVEGTDLLFVLDTNTNADEIRLIVFNGNDYGTDPPGGSSLIKTLKVIYTGSDPGGVPC